MNDDLVWPETPVSLEKLIDVGAENFQRRNLYFGHGTDNPWDEAMWLAFHALGLTWSSDPEVLQQTLNREQQRKVIALYQRRIDERKPAAYLTGIMAFAGLEFIVSPDVLVPRSPIAELIASHFKPWLVEAPARILDLCTGSGCIGIACATVFTEADVDCSDISTAALTIAESNIRRHQLTGRVRTVVSDMFAQLQASYDLIVSNPPYVDVEDLAAMPLEYRAEPELGLAAGDDGLDFCRRILRAAPSYLNPGGCLIVEVGNSWQALEQAFPQVPFTWIEFEYGGQGVFIFSAEELAQYAPYFGDDDIIR